MSIGNHDMAGIRPGASVPWDGGGGLARRDHSSAPPPIIDAFEQTDAPASVKFLKYWNLALKYRWLLAATLFAGVVVGVFVTMQTTRVYRATATVQIDTEPAKVKPVAGEHQNEAQDGSDTFYPTQYELLRSRALAERVVTKENLINDPVFMGQWQKRSRGGPTPLTPPKTAAERTARVDAAAGLISGHLLIEPIRLSRVVKISYESPDPAMAAKVANAVAANYITWNLERRYSATADARRFLEERLQQTRQALEDSQRRGNDYAQRNQLITIEGGGAGSEGDDTNKLTTGESLVAVDLASINAQLATATAARIQAEQRWRQAQSTSDMALPEILSNPAIQILKANRDTAWSEYQQGLRIYKPDWPTMVDARKKVDVIDQQIAGQAAAIRNTLRTELEVARKNEAQFQGEVNRRKGELLASQTKRVEQNFINTDINTSRSLYDAMLASYKEIGIATGASDNNISFVDKAKTPGWPFKPNARRNLTQFAMLGLGIGVLLAFLLDRFDISLKVPGEVEADLRLALLGTIPVAPKGMTVKALLDDPTSMLSEAYYSVRSALQFSTEDGVPSSLLVTSTQPSEGKTTSALAIARSYARLGLRVLLVDADMRAASLHRILARDNGAGLSNLLASGSEMSIALQPTSYPSLTFLAAGPSPPNPAELLGSRKMRAFLEAVRGEFDLVVIDGPPVMGLADAPQLASLVKGTVMVVESGRTNREMAKGAIRRLRMTHARLLGAIMTKFDLHKAGYAYGHAHGYGYGYGYGLDYGSKPEPVRRGLLPGFRSARRRA